MITKLTSEKCIKSLNLQDWHSWHVENIVQIFFRYFYVHNTHKVYNLVLFKDFQSTIGDLDINKTLILIYCCSTFKDFKCTIVNLHIDMISYFDILSYFKDFKWT
jgi:hypothetical protein